MTSPQAFQVDLSNCEREPIHQSGAIQPHGVLFLLDPSSFDIVRLSVNTHLFFGIAYSALLGRPIDVILESASVSLMRDIAGAGGSRMVRANPLRVRAKAIAGAGLFDAVLHATTAGLLVELEAVVEGSGHESDFYHSVRRAVSGLHHVNSVEELCQRAVEEVRRMTGFDRVMAYRFDVHDNGHVIAEDKPAHLDSYLDLHYPASDIPAQARRLYTLNHVRTIVDMAYRPVAIAPVQGEPLDLSDSVLRSVSPIHIEYMQKMGIAASMSLSLVSDNRLWGLIICHHYAPRFVAYELRASCEFLAQALSWQVASRERADLNEKRLSVDGKLLALMRTFSESEQLADAPTQDPTALLGLVSATGGALVHGGHTSLFGVTPSAEEVEQLVHWLQKRIETGIFATEQLSTCVPIRNAANAAGVLAMPLAKERGSYVLWFRAEVMQTVNWAGDPNKVVTLEDGAPRLSPRGSFALWKETVREQSLPWQPWEVSVAVDFGHALASLVLARSAELEKLNRELRLAGLAKDEFLATVSHELRTPLNAMLGWLSLIRTKELEPDRFDHAIETVERNARVQAKLIEDLLDVSRIISGNMRLERQPLDFAEIVDVAVQTVLPSAQGRGLTVHFSAGSGQAMIDGDSSRLHQVVWNLLANAVKFTSVGRIDVTLEARKTEIALTVTDTGEGIAPAFLPHVFERFRQAQNGAARRHQGLGLGLAIVRHLTELHGGSVSVASPGKGLGSTFTIRLPRLPVGPAYGGGARAPRAHESVAGVLARARRSADPRGR